MLSPDLDAPGVPGFRGVPSTVALTGRHVPDTNGFVTALAARACRLAGRPAPDDWLDVLEQCRHGDGFGFWPAGLRPGWAPALPADADDTAVMTLELLHAGRLAASDAVRIAYRSLARHRVARTRDPGPAWIRRGVFATWHRTPGGLDLIDCTVNANVLALLAALDLLHLPGVAQSVEMLAAAVSWAGENPLRAASLSPFYPEPAEFVLALAHAVAAGAAGLEAAAAHAAAAPWAAPLAADPARYAICSSPYGAVRWHSPDLVRLRAEPALR